VKFIVAVSGGIDSVVLLHMLVESKEHELIVAHFDHGIRPDSESDARFVQVLAESYHLPFVIKREELGAGASEELARTRRYAFLRSEGEKHKAIIMTAHHADDVIETIAINLIRGTGWRGVGVFGMPGLVRPSLRLTKEKIRAYARVMRLEWVEDDTNESTKYLRNKVRKALAVNVSLEEKQAVLGIWKQQRDLRREIEAILGEYVQSNGEYERHYLIQIDSRVACEFLRTAIFARTGVTPTRPQLERVLLAVKTARAGTLFEIAHGAKLRFSQRTFIVETP
jgi:tRNA(Ile)-lysidine synthetase-like protein